MKFKLRKTFDLRYSLGGVPNRPLALLVDGVQTALVNFSTTATWSIWNSVQVSVSIPQGNHTISLKTTGKSGPNIDQVEVSYATTNSVSSLYYVHNDHLNTPQVITDANQQVVWMGNYEPFGKIASNASNSIEIFSRFPGQYLDSETGLYYNYFRDYDPSIGRYIESDPIGLGGGINTYAYVSGNPLINSDPFGLFSPARPAVRPAVPGVRPAPGVCFVCNINDLYPPIGPEAWFGENDPRDKFWRDAGLPDPDSDYSEPILEPVPDPNGSGNSDKAKNCRKRCFPILESGAFTAIDEYRNCLRRCMKEDEHCPPN